MDNFRNNEQNNQDIRSLRDNFKNIREYKDDIYGANHDDEEQMQRNRDLRDNFKNLGNKNHR